MECSNKDINKMGCNHLHSLNINNINNINNNNNHKYNK